MMYYTGLLCTVHCFHVFSVLLCVLQNTAILCFGIIHDTVALCAAVYDGIQVLYGICCTAYWYNVQGLLYTVYWHNIKGCVMLYNVLLTDKFWIDNALFNVAKCILVIYCIVTYGGSRDE
jgi:hypothetical protein